MSDRKVPWHKKNNSNNGSVGGGGAYKKNQVGPSKSNNNRVGNWNNSSDGGYGNPKNRQYASPNIEPWDTRQRRNNNDHSWIKSNRGMKRSYNLTTHDDTCVQNFEPSGKSSRTSYDQSPVDTYHHSSSYGQLREEMSKFDGFNREPVQIIKENWRDGGGLGQRRYQNNEPPVNPYGDGWISGIPGEEHTSSGYNRSPLTYNRGSPKKSALNFENAQVKREVIATKLPSEAVQPRMKRVKDPGWKPAPLKEPLHEWGKGWKPIMTENYQKICAKMEARATLGTRFGKIDNRGKEVPLISQAKVIREFAPKTIDPNEANTEASRSPEVAMGSLYIEVTPNVSDANEAALSENVEKESDEADPDIPSGNKAALTIDLHKGHPVDEPEKEDGLIIDEEREKLVEQNPASENLQET